MKDSAPQTINTLIGREAPSSASESGPVVAGPESTRSASRPEGGRASAPPTGERLTALRELEQRISSGDYYHALGVGRNASKAEIKAAYFALVKQFRFERSVQDDQPQKTHEEETLEQKVFSALTKAHDALGRKKTRREYDLYLESRQQTRSLSPAHGVARPSPEQFAQSASRSIVVVEEVTKNRERSAVRDPRVETMRPLPQTETEVRRAESQPPNSTTRQKKPAVDQQHSPHDPRRESHERRSTLPPGRRADSNEARRKNLARKLHSQRSSKSGTNHPAMTDALLKERAKQNFQAQYAAKKEKADSGLMTVLAKADEATVAGDLVKAVLHLREAVELEPNSMTLLDKLQKAELAAEKEFSGQFLQQAQYEEQAGEYSRAGKSYAKVARALNEARYFHQSAVCYLKAPNAGKTAIGAARSAIRLEPSVVDYHLTLARAYDVTGMKTSAITAVQSALELEPGHP
ncbi:MAG: DnaJ domain-containing protein, partial [Polyangiaceae bacterium]|nr:DnaJ domain-containing protein [Polyangiaceae bacterium]